MMPGILRIRAVYLSIVQTKRPDMHPGSTQRRKECDSERVGCTVRCVKVVSRESSPASVCQHGSLRKRICGKAGSCVAIAGRLGRRFAVYIHSCLYR